MKKRDLYVKNGEAILTIVDKKARRATVIVYDVKAQYIRCPECKAKLPNFPCSTLPSGVRIYHCSACGLIFSHNPNA